MFTNSENRVEKLFTTLMLKYLIVSKINIFPTEIIWILMLIRIQVINDVAFGVHEYGRRRSIRWSMGYGLYETPRPYTLSSNGHESRGPLYTTVEDIQPTTNN
ncbi:hypothetical protein CR513_59044, partial [Mucuna pruriens]